MDQPAGDARERFDRGARDAPVPRAAARLRRHRLRAAARRRRSSSSRSTPACSSPTASMRRPPATRRYFEANNDEILSDAAAATIARPRRGGPLADRPPGETPGHVRRYCRHMTERLPSAARPRARRTALAAPPPPRRSRRTRRIRTSSTAAPRRRSTRPARGGRRRRSAPTATRRAACASARRPAGTSSTSARAWRRRSVHADVKDIATVPRLFRQIQRAIDRKAHDLTVTYGTHGVPTKISIDTYQNVIDEEQYFSDPRVQAPVARIPSGRMAWNVIIAGGGFGGFYAARTLARVLPPHSARVRLVTEDNFMLYTPLLPGAAAGTLEPRHVVVPLREELDTLDPPAPGQDHRRVAGAQRPARALAGRHAGGARATTSSSWRSARSAARCRSRAWPSTGWR